MSKDLSAAQCILLTVHYASSGNIKALHSFTPTRSDALDPEFVLRILLTYLPESIEPKGYTKYVGEVGSRLYLDYEREDVEVDLSPVKELSEERAQKQVKKLHLSKLLSPKYPPHAPQDFITQFVCQRAYRIDEQTGLLDLIPQLVEPFLDRNAYLRSWYVSVVLPVLRLECEYYPQDGAAPRIALSEFERLEPMPCLDFLLQKGVEENGNAAAPDSPTTNAVSTAQKRTMIARDVKGLVGPWMYGDSERKRRKLDRHTGEQDEDKDDVAEVSRGMRKISLSGVGEEDKTGHDWEYMFKWMVSHARNNFSAITQCIEDWDGPGDVDFGGIVLGSRDYLDEDVQRKLELQYAQAAFAACYAAQDDSTEVVRGAHAVLARLAELLDFIPPPDLASSVESLPKIERHATLIDQSRTTKDLEPDNLLEPEHPLTTPRLETYMLLQMMVYSAYQLLSLGQPMSLVNVTKLHFYSTAEGQLSVLQKILRGLSKSGARKDEAHWTADRGKLMWLWNWGIDGENDGNENGAGVLGKINKGDFEEEMLKVFVDTSLEDVDPVQNTDVLGGATQEELSFPFVKTEEDEKRVQQGGCDLAIKLYITDAISHTRLPPEVVEETVLSRAMEAYDGASNGNRTRGGVRKANDILTAFRPHFRDSTRFRQASALISATHALSFYSLTLQHGVPFKPVSIRVSSDPIGLIDKVLEQNSRSYTKLDDLVDIAQNLVSAGLPPSEDADGEDERLSADELARRRKEAERRVTFMAVEAALREDDFETAYSYIVNRLTPSGADITVPKDRKLANKNARTSSRNSTRSKTEPEDDISWRAAFLAGRYRPATISPPTLRRLEQRTELLSLALLLAPTSALTDILAAWRRCEEETTSLQLSQQQAEEEFDDRADKRVSTSALPGNFTVGGEQPEMVLNQKRREMGRMGAAATGKVGEDQAPMSMFDLTRSAARAFSQNAFPLRAGAAASGRSSEEGQGRGLEASVESLGSDGDGQQRVRKRDMVANAVSGGLASGLGWMLGATPVDRQGQEED